MNFISRFVLLLRQSARNTWFWLYSDYTAFASLVEEFLRKSKYELTYHDKKGEVAVVTGGGRGLGKSIVKGLVKCGMHVIIGVRKPELCDQLKKELEENNPGTIEVLQLDTSSIESIKDFANKVTSKYQAINILINNAGIILRDFELTKDGFESHLATNYVGHFYLTHLLMKALERGVRLSFTPSKIVNVSSCSHVITKIYFDNINLSNNYNRYIAYAQSKLAQIMTAKYLDRYAQLNNIPIRSFSCHPGVVHTGMMDDFRKKQPIFNWIVYLSKTCDEGAKTVLFPCLTDEFDKKGGQYFVNCAEGNPSNYSRDEAEQNKLFEFICKLLNISSFGIANNHN